MPDANTEDRELLHHALQQAGEIAMGFFGRNPKHWRKKDGSTVTEADIAVDEILKKIIGAARPNDGWLSEETPDTAARLTQNRVWIADPIDGTSHYLAGHDGWCIGMALLENGKPIVAGLLKPHLQILYGAELGKGATCNAQPLHVDGDGDNNHVIGPKPIADKINAAGFTFQSGSQLPLLLRFAAIAEGALAGAVSLGPRHDWDLAPGHLILTEAGGIVTNEQGGPMLFNTAHAKQPGLVAASRRCHTQLLNSIRKR